MPFPEILLALRLSNGLSQQQLAERANVAEITIQNYESGRSNPVPTRLLAIADVLGVSLDTLVGRDENAFSPPDFDPLVEQVKSLSAPQRADVMKYMCELDAAFAQSPFRFRFRRPYDRYAAGTSDVRLDRHIPGIG